MTKAIYFLLIVFFASSFCVAQNQNEKIEIKIDANINGEKIKIDTTIDQIDNFDIDAFLENLGINEELNHLEIDITNGGVENFNFSFNEDALNTLLKNIENIEMPEMPEMPHMPAVLPFENIAFFNGNKAYLGVSTEKSKDPDGVSILEVMENSAASEAGLKEGDIIQMIENKTVESPNNLVEILSDYEPNQKITITYLRNGNKIISDAILKENEANLDGAEWESYQEEMENWGEKFADQMEDWGENVQGSWSSSSTANCEEHGFLGVIINDMDLEPGIKISEIIEKSAAEEAGLKSGDIINTINEKVLHNYDELSNLISSLKPSELVTIEYTRNGKQERVQATLKSNKELGNSNNWNQESGENMQSPLIKVYSCSPGVNSYSYCLDEKKKSIKMSIKVIENDKTNSEKSIYPLNPSLDPQTIQFYPNPSNGQFTLQFRLENQGDTKIIVRNIDGGIVYEESISAFQGNYEKEINLGTEAKGTYFVNIIQGNNYATKQIVIQ